MNACLEEISAKEHFKNFCEKSALFKVGRSKAFEALHNLNRWTEFLPHVEGITVIYDDGRYQEFLMEVRSASGSLINVRSVRKCKAPSEITFFQPKPPVFLKHHCGGWRFTTLGDSLTEVKAWHAWDLEPVQASQIFPEKDGRSTEELVGNTLIEHAQFALSNWKKVLEEGRYS